MLNREKTLSTTVLIGSIDYLEILNGVIIRDETVYKADRTGEVVYFKNDLEKVRNGATVVTISEVESIDIIKNEISKIDKDKWRLQELRGDDLSLAQKDAKIINKQIKGYIDINIFDFSNQNLDNLYTIKDEIDKKINLRNKLLLEENRNSGLSTDEKSLVLSELYNSQNNISVTSSGIISYHFDGLEELYSPENMQGLTKEHIGESKEKEFIPMSSLVKEGEGIFKLVNSNDWYIGTFISNKIIENWKENETRIIYIENGNNYDKLKVTIDKINKQENESYILFKSTKNILNYMEMRNIRFKTSENEEIGLKIPSTAIVEQTILEIPTEFIYGSNTNVIKVKRAIGEPQEVFISTKEKSLNEGQTHIIQRFGVVEFGDILINPNNPSDTFEIKTSKVNQGVYKISSGIAEFREINLKENTNRNSEFVILDLTIDQKIKTHDLIATNAIEIVEGQKIYTK